MNICFMGVFYELSLVSYPKQPSFYKRDPSELNSGQPFLSMNTRLLLNTTRLIIHWMLKCQPLFIKLIFICLVWYIVIVKCIKI